MLLGFIGSPGSGKTTTAAALFFRLKEQGTLSEFIPEQARWHVAEAKLLQSLSPVEVPKLSEEDHMTILERQLRMERLMVKSSSPETIIVCDSSAWNSLLYLGEAARKCERVLGLIRQVHYDLLFYCPPIRKSSPNETEDLIPSVLTDILWQWQPVYGDPEERARQCLRSISKWQGS